METFATESISYDTTFVVPTDTVPTDDLPPLAEFDPEELTFRIGVWLVGIRAFSGECREIFAAEGKGTGVDPRREFRIINASLLETGKCAFRLRRSLAGGRMVGDITLADIDELSLAIRNATLLGESLSNSNALTFAEWNAWNDLLKGELMTSAAAQKAIRMSLASGSDAVPHKLRSLLGSAKVPAVDKADLADILPRVGTALRFLEVVGEMLKNDEPLKPALLIFSAVHDQTKSLIDHINNRLARFADEEAALFNSLDSASYSASLELKKVFQQELRGITSVLPPPSVFARVETAYSLLLDSFQQILLDLGRIVDPNVTLFDFFPRFQAKLDQSLVLRDHLWRILTAVRAAEESPEEANDGLKNELESFVGVTIRYLHYKDGETFERFTEEVNAAREKKDLVPILHRFGAYLETLFGQVSMRAVLGEHPFEHAAPMSY